MNLAFFGCADDENYLSNLKECLGAARCNVSLVPITTIYEVTASCRSKGINSVISTSVPLLKRLLGRETETKNPSLADYAGSMFTKDGIEIVFLPPLAHLIKVPYGKFLFKHFISKLTNKHNWNVSLNFEWCVLDANNIEKIYTKYQDAFLIAVDIETRRDLSISCVGYTAVFLDPTTKVFTTHSCVFPVGTMWAVTWMRKFNELPAGKILQNGKYDCSYFARYNAPLFNYLWDTATMFHCWYSELPKDLGFLGSFFVREAMYWKDLADTTDLQQYYFYNCRDHWTTAIVALEWFRLAPEFARKNYVLEFPLVHPCHFSEMLGIARDAERLKIERDKVTVSINAGVTSLQKMCGAPVNSNSPTQMVRLLKILGCGHLTDSNETTLKKAIFVHPLNARIFNTVLDIRGWRKLKSTYLRSDDDITSKSPGGAKEFKGRILYALNPHGTDTGRLASREHHFWCGLQIQNIPRGFEVKNTVVADPEFSFAEADLKQAESRDTAYITGELALIRAVESDDDFHSRNAAAFFGVPYSEIYSNLTTKTLNKKLRDLAKRVNHGATYVMGPDVLVDTMGYDKILEARALLNLNKMWGFKKIAEYLLEQFHKTYPRLQQFLYPGVVQKVLTTSQLTGATGWTRYCFGRPDKNKRDLNAYVAHEAQSLNAMVLNEAYLRVFYQIQMNPTHSRNFKLCAQIHDSIFFQFRVGHEYLCEMVAKLMEIPVTVTGYDGVTRTFVVPADIKAGKDGKGAKYWSETE